MSFLAAASVSASVWWRSASGSSRIAATRLARAFARRRRNACASAPRFADAAASRRVSARRFTASATIAGASRPRRRPSASSSRDAATAAAAKIASDAATPVAPRPYAAADAASPFDATVADARRRGRYRSANARSRGRGRVVADARRSGAATRKAVEGSSKFEGSEFASAPSSPSRVSIARSANRVVSMFCHAARSSGARSAGACASANAWNFRLAAASGGVHPGDDAEASYSPDPPFAASAPTLAPAPHPTSPTSPPSSATSSASANSAAATTSATTSHADATRRLRRVLRRRRRAASRPPRRARRDRARR